MPQNARLSFNLGMCYSNLGAFADAVGRIV